MSVFVAIGTIGSQLLWFPAGIAKAYPVQHAINVIAAIMLGPGPAVAIAFMIGLLRNMLGLGSLLAFPRSEERRVGKECRARWGAVGGRERVETVERES